MSHLGPEIGSGGRIGGVDAAAGRHVGFGIGNEHRNVVAHAAPRQADLAQRNPLRQFEHLADHPRRAQRAVEEAAAFGRSVGQRRGPVVAPRDLEGEALGVFDRRRGEQRLNLPAGVDLLIDVGRTVHDDIGDVEDIGIVERRGLGVHAQRVDRAVVERRPGGRAEGPVGRKTPVEQRQHLAVEKRLREGALDIPPVRPGQRRSRRGVEPLTDLVPEVIHIAARPEPEPVVHLPVGGKRGHHPVAHAPAADAVDDPVGILLEIVARGDPLLHVQLAVLVVDRVMLPVRGHVHAARKAVQTDQRVHVETARHGFVLNRLAHEADVAVETQPLAEQFGDGAQVEIVAHQAVFPGDAPLGGVGVGEVVLNLLRTGRDGNGVDRRHARPEKLPGIVVRLHAAARAPALHAAAHPVTVLELRQAERRLESQVRGEGHGLLPDAALLGRDQNDAVGGLAAVQRRGRSALEDRNALDVLGIEIRDAVAAVAVPGVGDSADGRISLLGRGVEHRHSVDHIQRLVVAGHRTHAADTHLGGRSRPRRGFTDLHAGRFTGKRQNQVGRFDGRELRTFDLVGGIGQVDVVAFESQRRHDHVFDGLHILLQDDLQLGAAPRLDTAREVTQTRNVENGARTDADREQTVRMRGHAVRGSPFHDGNPGQRVSRFVGDAASDRCLLRRGPRADHGTGGKTRPGDQEQGR